MEVSNCSVNNNAASVSDVQAYALAELAKAAVANAQAIGKIAEALKGAEAHMGEGFKFIQQPTDNYNED